MASQSASPVGHHNIIVQASGDGIQVQVGLPWLELVPAERRVRAAPRTEVDILDPVYQAVPLVGREGDLDFLRGWLGGERKIAITALTGAGGSGKTRLALEVLLKNLPEAWQGGFLSGQEAKRFLDGRNLASWSWQKPTLIVVDYAALIAETLSNWFRELADHPVPEKPLRILLLERHAEKDEGWYGGLADGSFQGRAVRELIWPLEPRRISPLGDMDQRRQVLTAALAAAAALQPPVNSGVAAIPLAGADPWFDRRLGDDQWKDPLLLLMAAVIAGSSGIHAALKLSRPELAKEMAKRECARVRNSVPDRTAKDLLVHLYACVTLCGGLSLDDAATVAEAEFGVRKMQYPGGPGQAVRDLATLLGGRNWLPSMTPDLLGEAFLLLVLGDFGPSVIARLGSFASKRVAATVIRSVQDFSHWGEAAPMEWAKALVAAGEQDLDILLAIEGALPEQTLALRGLAVEVTRSLVVQLRRQSDLDERSLEGLGSLLNNLSNRQSDMGQRAEALASVREAVGIRRALAEANPDAFLPDLAASLNNQASSQSEMGQRAEALASVGEAVDIRRVLAETDPDAFLPDLAKSLNNQAAMQSDMGQHAEALASIVEPVRHYRALAQANPDSFLPHLAMSLNNQAIMQSDMGQRAEALASIAEAVRHYRALAEANPDAFLPDLAMSLSNQARSQSDMGQHAEALDSVAEALRYYRALADANPDAFLPDLAKSLNNQANRQSDLGQYAEALASISEAVRHYRALAGANPDSFLPSLATSLNNQALYQGGLGQRAEGLASIAEAVRYYRALADANPDAFLPDLARSLTVQGNCLAALDRLSEARDAAGESLGCLAPFCARFPGVFGALAKAMLRDYFVRTQELGEEPDYAVLSPYFDLFGKGETE